MIFPSRWEQGLETYQVGQRPQSPWWSQECQKTDLFPVSLLSDWELLPRGHMSLMDWDWEEARGHLVISRGLTHSLSSLSLIPVSALNLWLHGSLFPRLLHTEALPSPSYASTCDSIVNSLMLTLCGLRTSFFTFMRPESKATGWSWFCQLLSFPGPSFLQWEEFSLSQSSPTIPMSLKYWNVCVRDSKSLVFIRFLFFYFVN